MDNQISRITESIQSELLVLPTAPPTGYSIFRVPRKLRELNERAYTPQMVSIGPLHHGKPDLIAMEHYKMQYLKDLLDRAPLDLECCVRKIKESEARIRNCYGERTNLDSDQFVKMVLMDSAFIIESILKDSSSNRFSALSAYVQLDMILIENQLPFFVLEEIYNQFAISTRRRSCASFLELSRNYFSYFPLTIETTTTEVTTSSSAVKHFVDLLRMINLPPPLSQRLEDVSGKYVRVKNVTTLHEAGMKFKAASSKDGRSPFAFDKGILYLPQLSIQDTTQPVLMNIIALEHYVYPHQSYMLNLIFFMDGLIDTPRDVDILVQNDVLQNLLGDSSAVANMFNKLSDEVLLTSDEFYFYSLSKDLNSYCEVRWHKWKATLRRNYFSSPWLIASTIAAFILLSLTFIQTSVVYYWDDDSGWRTKLLEDLIHVGIVELLSAVTVSGNDEDTETVIWEQKLEANLEVEWQSKRKNIYVVTKT